MLKMQTQRMHTRTQGRTLHTSTHARALMQSCAAARTHAEATQHPRSTQARQYKCETGVRVN